MCFVFFSHFKPKTWVSTMVTNNRQKKLLETMGNAPPVKTKKQTEVERLKELAEANFRKTHEFKSSDSVSPETDSVPKEPVPERPKIDWDNVEGPSAPSRQQSLKQPKDSAGELILDGKIKSVAQINWKHDELNPDAQHVTVYDAIEEYDKKLDGIKKHQSLQQKEKDELEAAERERQRQVQIDERNSLEGSDGRQNETENDYHNEEGEELMLRSSSSMMNDEDEGEEDQGPDPFFEEETTLFELYHLTQPWKENELDIYGWSDEIDVTTWSGITCDKPVPISSLKQHHHRSQSGSFREEEEEEARNEQLRLQNEEEEIGNPIKLTHRGFVRRLYLDDHCAIGGRLPQTGWDKLSCLKILSLSHNQLDGDIPIELALCKTLQVLNLSCNKLCGEIPTEFSALKSLTHLWLYANQLEGSLPSELFSLDGCNKLTSLRLKRNLLTGEIPLGVGSLHHLEEFDVEENQLNGSLPDTFMKLTKLRVLRVANNKLGGPLPVHYLESMSSLKDLRFYHNKFDQHTISKMAVMRTVSDTDGFDF